MKNLVIFFCTILFSSLMFSQTLNVTNHQIKQSNTLKNYAIDAQFPNVDFGKDALMGMRGVAQDINNSISEIINNQIAIFIPLTATAIINPELKYSNALTITYEITYKSANLISAKFQVFTEIVGYAHPVTTYISFNYSLNSSGVFGIAAFFNNQAYLSFISNYCQNELKAQAAKQGYTNTVGEITNGASANVDNFKIFNITSTSLTITFAASQVGPNVLGSPTIEIPLSKLKNFIDANGPFAFLF